MHAGRRLWPCGHANPVGRAKAHDIERRGVNGEAEGPPGSIWSLRAMVLKRQAYVAVLAIGALALAGCLNRGPSNYNGGFHMFGGGPKAPAAPIGVNGYLWRASLDTL